jgi:HSP20 family molecular chaperone IbpA
MTAETKNAVAAQHHRPAWPDISDLFSGFPSWAEMRRPMFGGHHPIKVEDEIKEGTYQLHAEIPGVDPAEGVDVTVCNGMLTIKAERSEKKEANGRSEFTYGSFTRSVTLPAGADEAAITASYDKGILTVTVPLEEQGTPERHVAVESAG